MILVERSASQKLVSSIMLQPGKQHVICLVRSIVLRKLSSESTRPVTNSFNVRRRPTETATPLDNDRDVFGTLSTSGRKSLQVQRAEKVIPDDPDGYDKIDFDIVPRKNMYYYKYEIPKYARQGAPGLKKALELFQQMKSKDRLEPTSDNFSTLIYGCAKAGYTKRAFDLYEESLRYLRRPTNSVVTCLINACGESPFPDYGLERLRWFLTHIKVEYNKQLNEVQYNSAIKAFGKLGQLEEASKLVQEMLDNDVMPTIDTFNMLLIACASNRESGGAIALRVFKRLKMYNFKPTVTTYRLLLRCIRDCRMGSAEMIEEILKELPAMTSFDQRFKYRKMNQKNDLKRKFTSNFEWVPLISDLGHSIKDAISKPREVSDKSIQVVKKESINLQNDRSPSDDKPIESHNDELVTHSNSHQLPNLLSDDHLDLMIRIKSIEFNELAQAHQRMMLFGGVRGYLETMMRDNCRPDAKTFSLLLPCQVPTRENYLEYHKLAEEMGIKRDTSYYDQLIRDICKHGLFKKRLELALYFLEQMHLDNLRPNISTFESLACGCKSWAKAERLIDDVKKCGFVVSDVMIYNLLRAAIKTMNFHYLNHLIEYCDEVKFKPLGHLVEALEELRLKTNNMILKHEKGELNDRVNEAYVKQFDRFRIRMKSWLKSTELAQETHPWKQFKVDTSSKRDGFREFKEHFKALEKETASASASN